MKIRRSFLLAALGAMVAVLVAGCASPGAADSRAPEEIVLERAQARWNALLKGDWATAYRYTSPAYRSIVPPERYGNQFSGPVQWEGAKAKSAKCEAQRCLVAVEVSVRILLPGHRNNALPTNYDEVWIFEDGQWFKFESL